MEILIKATDQASATFDKIKSSGEQGGNILQQSWVKVGLACTGAAVAIEAMARAQAPLTEQTKQLALSTGMTEDAFRKLVLETSNVTFPIESVLKTMKAGREEGIKSAEALKDYANFWDMVGDATGNTGESLAEAGTALRTVGIEVGNETEALNAFGYITQETTLNVADFLSFLGKAGPDLREMGMSVDDAAAMIGYLSKEFGYSGKVAKTEFSQAVLKANGDMGVLFQTLGVSPQKFGQYKTAVSDCNTVISDYRDINNDTYTTMQKMQHAAGELTYQFGGMIQSLSGFAPALVGIGPVMGVFDTLKKSGIDLSNIMPKIAGAISGIVPALGGIGLALGPILPIIVGLVIAGAALYLAWETNFLGIRDIVGNAMNFVQDRMKGVQDVLGKAWDGLGKIGEALGESFGKIFGKLDNVFKKITGGVSIVEVLGRVMEVAGKIWDLQWRIIGKAVEVAADLIIGGIGWITDRIVDLIDWFGKLAKNPFIKALIDAFLWAGEKVGSVVGDMIGGLNGWLDSMDDGSDASADFAAQVTGDAGKVAGAQEDMASRGVDTFEKLLESMQETSKQSGDTKDQVVGDSKSINQAWSEPATKTLIIKMMQDTLDQIPGGGSANLPMANNQAAPTFANMINAQTAGPSNQNGGYWQTDDKQWWYTDERGQTRRATAEEATGKKTTTPTIPTAAPTGTPAPAGTPSGSGTASSGTATSEVPLAPTGNPYKKNADGTYSTTYDDQGNYVGGMQSDSGASVAYTATTDNYGSSGTGSNYGYGVYGEDPRNPGKYVAIGTGKVTGADAETGQGGTETIEYFDWYLEAMADQAEVAEDATRAAKGVTTATEDLAGTSAMAAKQIGSSAGEIAKANQNIATSHEQTSKQAAVSATAMKDALLAKIVAMKDGSVSRAAEMSGSIIGSVNQMSVSSSADATQACDIISQKFSDLVAKAQGASGGMTPSAPGMPDSSLPCPFNGSEDGNSVAAGSSTISTKTTVNATGFISPARRLVESMGVGLPCLAEGGDTIREGLAIVGDNGPEIVSLPAAARVTPLSRGEGSGGGIRDVHMHIHGVVVADKAGLRKLARMLNSVMISEDIRKGGNTG